MGIGTVVGFLEVLREETIGVDGTGSGNSLRRGGEGQETTLNRRYDGDQNK
jgi:hypothetical protein